MYFKRLEMHGFKSFADPVVIEFHEGITCVVGPNGSAKRWQDGRSYLCWYCK